MKLSKINLFFVSLAIGLSLALPLGNLAEAQSALPDLLPACAETGACRICDLIGIFITLGRWLIAGAALLALMVIVYAGSRLVISQGNAEQVGAAKKQIVGAVLGLGLVLVAFQLVTFIIFAVTTPSAQQTPSSAQTPDSSNPTQQNLGSFLTVNGTGLPWWKICDQNELLQNGNKSGGKGLPPPSTASCTYWGDGTACSSSDAAKKCCKGLCTADKCETLDIIAPVVKGKPEITAPIQNLSACDLTTEEGVRKCLLDLGKITIQASKPSCRVGSNGEGCINTEGLPEKTISTLVAASKQCGGCIVVTGGTEPGHKSHGPGLNVVDVDYSSTAARALEAVGVLNNGSFGIGYTCEGCKSRGTDGQCAQYGAVACGPAAGWMHVEI